MLLQALNEFYKRASKPNENGRILIQEAAFTDKYIRWVIPLKLDGGLDGNGLTENPNLKNEGRTYSVPRTARAKKGREAEFLVDGLDSIFGLNPDIENPKNEDMLAKKHSDFWRQIEAGFAETNSPMLKAVLIFRESCQLLKHPEFLRWGNLKEGEKKCWLVKTAIGKEEKFDSANAFTFQINGNFLFEDQELRDFWRKAYSNELAEKSEDADIGVCLVTGEENVPLVASHIPPIKNIPGGQPVGAYLVSFEKSSPAFSSYGKIQSYNSPISYSAVEGYINALIYLVNTPEHHLRIGNTKLLFWANKSETDWISAFFEGDEKTIELFMKKPFWGDSFLPQFDNDKMYSVTLNGNSGRIVIRHWMQMTVGRAKENFQKWFEDLTIQTFGHSDTQEAKNPLSLYRLASTTIRKTDSRKKKDEEKFFSELQTELYKTALEGKTPSLLLAKRIVNRLTLDLSKWGVEILKTPTPANLLRKISEDKEPFPPISQSRFALLRLIINRNRKEYEPMIEKELTNIDDEAYVCGRLFAVLDELQREALATKKIRDGKEYWEKFDGAGVIERFYSSASARPAIAFPYLLRLHHHHLRKLAQVERKWLEKRFIEKIAKISDQLKGKKFPTSLSLTKQGRFALGFYQQIAAGYKEMEENIAKRKAEQNQQIDQGEQK